MKKSNLLRITALFFAFMLCFTLLSRAADQAGIAVVTMAKPDHMMITHQVTAAGKVSQNRELAVVTEADQRVTSIEVNEGQRVEKGDLLFTIDTDLLEEKILNQQMEMEKQELQVQDAKSQNEVSQQQKANEQAQAAENFSLSTGRAGTQLSRAKQELSEAKKALENFRKNSGTVTEEESAVEDSLMKACEEKADAYIAAQQELASVQWKIENAVNTALQNAASTAALQSTKSGRSVQSPGSVTAPQNAEKEIVSQNVESDATLQSAEIQATLVPEESVLTQAADVMEDAGAEIILEASGESSMEMDSTAGDAGTDGMADVNGNGSVTGSTAEGRRSDAGTGSIIYESDSGAGEVSGNGLNIEDIIIVEPMENPGGSQNSPLTGDTAGSQNGSVTGDAAGTQNGALSGDITGSQNGSVTGDTTGTQNGSAIGDATDSQNGSVTGDTTGTQNDSVAGDATGSQNGAPSGNTTGTQLTQAEADKIEQSVRADYQAELDAAQEKVNTAYGEKTAAEDALIQYQQERLSAQNSENSQTEEQLIANVQAAQQAYEDAAIAANEAAVTGNRSIQTAGIPNASNSSDRTNEITCEQMELNLKKLEELKEAGGKICAPSDGLVTKINIVTGEKTSDTTAILMADLSRGYRFTAEITREQEKYIGTGDLVTLKGSDKQTLEELPVESVTADETDESMYHVTVQLPEDSFEIGANLTMEFTKKSNAYSICVPVSALHLDEKNQPYVLVTDEYDSVMGTEIRARKVSVTILEQNETHAALAEGAISGQQEIIVSSDKAVDDGSRVREEV